MNFQPYHDPSANNFQPYYSNNASNFQYETERVNPQGQWQENGMDWNHEDFLDGMSVGTSFVKGGGTISSNNPMDGSQMKKKVSDAIVYGPRFCAIFDAYCKSLNLQIDTSRHLMSLCLDNLIPFIKWARESDSQVSWISNKLLDNDYLRCEVRNGVVMVLIYVFASIKAKGVEGLDMFLTLQDIDTGLGIANRFSLKIYNDPFNYLIFLKTSISSLIDAGAIPDNERVNQPKRNKMQLQNKEEIESYHKIQKMIIDLLDSGDVSGAKNLVTKITSYWQIRGKVSMFSIY